MRHAYALARALTLTYPNPIDIALTPVRDGGKTQFAKRLAPPGKSAISRLASPFTPPTPTPTSSVLACVANRPRRADRRRA